jgi:hypothetical protein
MTTRLSILATALAAALAVGCNSTPSGNNQTAIFTAQLQPANEVPAAIGTETAGSGSSTITLHFAQDSSNNVTSATADFQVNVSGFPSTTVFTMAHIHQAVAGVAGAIVVNTGIASGDVTLTNGAGSFTRTAIAVPSDIAQQMLANAANFYFNVHTVVNASGVARGQLVRTQ